jgi:SMI1-KNR4 cell-wall
MKYLTRRRIGSYGKQKIVTFSVNFKMNKKLYQLLVILLIICVGLGTGEGHIAFAEGGFHIPEVKDDFSSKSVYVNVNGIPHLFDQILSVSKEEEEEEDFCHVIGAYRRMYLDEDSDPTLPKGFVPFALDEQNKWYCFDYRKSVDSPSIVLINWEAHYEDDPDYVVTFIKESFNELLESLYEL